MNWMPVEDAQGVGDYLRKETAVNADRVTEKERESKERSRRCVSHQEHDVAVEDTGR
jgi:hypothetical protein